MGQILSEEDLKIRISGLPDGLHTYRFSVSPGSLTLDARFVEPVHVGVVLDRAQKQLYLKVDVQTAMKVGCDRCLEEYREPLESRFKIIYVYDNLGGMNHSPDEVQVLAPDAVVLDLAGDVGQAIKLSVPLKLLCKEECRGLCPRCGTNRNATSCECKDRPVDSRWQALERLLKN